MAVLTDTRRRRLASHRIRLSFISEADISLFAHDPLLRGKDDRLMTVFETTSVALLQRSPAWAAWGRVRLGRGPSTMQGHPSCRSKRMRLGAITSPSRSSG